MKTGWVVHQDGIKMGLFSYDQLCRQAREGTLKPRALLWHRGMKAWIQADRLTGLFPDSADTEVDTGR